MMSSPLGSQSPTVEATSRAPTTAEPHGKHAVAAPKRSAAANNAASERLAEAPSEPQDDTSSDASALMQLPPGADPHIDWGLRAHLDADGNPRLVTRVLVVPAEFNGLRLDHFIKTQIPRLSRTRIQRVIAEVLTRVDDGSACATPPPAPSATPPPALEVALDGADRHGTIRSPLRPAMRVRTNEAFCITRPAQPEPPCPRFFSEVYADDDVIVIDKPAGLPVHASAKFYFNTLTRLLDETYGRGHQPCHRLDRETSGAMVIARHRRAASVIKQAFAAKGTRKLYLALVWGHPPWPQTLDAPGALLRYPLRNSEPGDATTVVGVRMVSDARGLPSTTACHVIARSARFSLVQCQPITGRQHQIRVHCALAGYPLVGDKLYAHGDAAFKAFCDQGWSEARLAQFVLWRHGLHALHIEFPHPAGGVRRVQAGLAKDIVALWQTDGGVLPPWVEASQELPPTA